MIDLLDDNSDCAAIDRALRDDEAGNTIPGEIVNAIMDGATPLRAWRQHREFSLETIRTRVQRAPVFREELKKEAIQCIRADDVDTGKAVMRDYINAKKHGTCR